MTTWATARLDALVAGAAPPPVVATMRLGTLDAWGEGWARKRFEPDADQLNGDGSIFGVLERFPGVLNRGGFTRAGFCDSGSLPAREAGMNATIAIAGSAGTGCRLS